MCNVHITVYNLNMRKILEKNNCEPKIFNILMKWFTNSFVEEFECLVGDVSK